MTSEKSQVNVQNLGLSSQKPSKCGKKMGGFTLVFLQITKQETGCMGTCEKRGGGGEGRLPTPVPSQLPGSPYVCKLKTPTTQRNPGASGKTAKSELHITCIACRIHVLPKRRCSRTYNEGKYSNPKITLNAKQNTFQIEQLDNVSFGPHPKTFLVHILRAVT